jgi:copper chaperone CopZ
MELSKKTESSSGNYKSLTVKVSGMHCECCANSIEKSLSKVSDVRIAEVDLENAEIRLEFDQDKVELEKIRRAIKKAGFIPGVEQISD